MMRSPLTTRERIIATAIDMTTSAGWSTVTMGALADRAGVSRQTVYNELGTKSALAEAMVLTELQRFLALVDDAFERHPDDAEAALHGAVHDVISFAGESELLRAILDPLHEERAELLPPLTTESGLLYAGAKQRVARHLDRFMTHLTDEQREAVVDTVVRTTVSHVVNPSGSAEHTATGLLWLVRPALPHS